MLRSISNHSLSPAQSAEVPRSTAADQGGSLFDVHPEAFGSFRMLDNMGTARSAQEDVGAARRKTLPRKTAVNHAGRKQRYQ